MEIFNSLWLLVDIWFFILQIYNKFFVFEVIIVNSKSSKPKDQYTR
jgi:hypothetical protein